MEEEKEGWMRVMALHYALQIISLGDFFLWVGVKGVTPASHSVAMGLLPWQQAKQLISKYYPWPVERAGG